jgi:hypothetical protein
MWKKLFKININKNALWPPLSGDRLANLAILTAEWVQAKKTSFDMVIDVYVEIKSQKQKL